jgi:pSer/pThr/pTyr-binding forkhead associated (FHA) protein
MAPMAPVAGTARAPTTTGQGEAIGRLVLIGRDGAETASFPITATTDLGRSDGDIRIEDDVYLCPRHARLAMHGGAMTIIDLASVNGVYVRLSPPAEGGAGLPLLDQDLFLIGQQVIQFEVVSEGEEGFGSASQRGTHIFGTPLGLLRGRLTVKTVEGIGRDVYYLRKAETVLGRETGDILFTDDPFLSRRHVLIRAHHDRRSFELVDLRSSNGSFLRIRGEAVLHDGAQFRVGQQLFRFDRSKAP